MLFHWSEMCGMHNDLKTTDEDDEEAKDCETSGTLRHTAPLPLVSAEVAETLPPADFLPPQRVSVLLSKWGLFAKEATLDVGTGLFCTVKWNPSHGLALPPLLEGKEWDKPMEDCCWACARDQLIWPYRQASLGGTTFLRLWRKGNCEAQTHDTAQKQNYTHVLKYKLSSQLVWTHHCPKCHEPWEVIHALQTQV